MHRLPLLTCQHSTACQPAARYTVLSCLVLPYIHCCVLAVLDISIILVCFQNVILIFHLSCRPALSQANTIPFVFMGFPIEPYYGLKPLFFNNIQNLYCLAFYGFSTRNAVPTQRYLCLWAPSCFLAANLGLEIFNVFQIYFSSYFSHLTILQLFTTLGAFGQC